MFNVKILRMRDIRKCLVGIILTIAIVICTTRYFSSVKKENTKEKVIKETAQINIFKFGSLTSCLNKTIPTMSNINEEYKKIEKENKETETKNYLEEFIKTEMSSIKGIELAEENKQQKINEENNQTKTVENNQSTDTQENEKITLASNEATKTEVVTPNPIAENTNVQYGNVKIKNQTTYNLTEDILNPDIKIDNKNILIFHTHSCESYTPSEKYQYTQTGNYRTTDKNYSVIRVGTELENYLKQYNINVIHDTSYHDYPSYTGSYTRSLQTVENILKTNQSDIIIDLHRDAVGSRPDYAPTVKIGDDYAAQIMFVIGTNEGGLWHPNWQQNLKFAVKVQQKAEEMYPGLFKPIMLTKSRYNQHTGKYANIMEIGSTGNTLDQCLTSMKYLSAVLNEVLK